MAQPADPNHYDFNIGVEYQFPQEYTLSAAWVGSRGVHLPLARVSLNQLPLSVIGKYQAGLMATVPNTWAPVFPATSAFYNKWTVPQFLALEPFPQFNSGSINCGVTIFGYPGGDSIYHSLQLKLQKRLTSHFSTLAAYTWGKLITDDLKPPLSFIGSHSSTYQDWRNFNLERGLSPQDLSYSFTWQASYDLPLGKNRAIGLGRSADKLLRGWTANAIVYFSSGVPINAPTGTGDPYFSQRVNLTCDPAQGAPHTTTQWLNYACLAQPASPFFAGTAPAYLTHVRSDGGHNLDVSTYNTLPLTEIMNLQLHFAAYNVTNTSQLGYPRVFWNPNPTAANMAGFGQITSTVNVPRRLQFAAKFNF
jgi:hypothetical protein